MQAVCYLRAIPTFTFEAQQRAFLDECARSGLEVGPTFTETAAGPAAPEFRRMLRTLLDPAGSRQRGFTTVVVASLDVLGATAREQARRYLQLETLGLPLRLADGGDADAALLAAWSERPSGERRRDQVREGMRDRALRGEVLGRAPYGYRVVARHLRIEPFEAAVVRHIFDWYTDGGEGVRLIARRLNEADTRTRRGGSWSIASVRQVLRNPVYTGLYRRLGVVVATEHEAIVTRDRFAAVQQRLAARRTSFGQQRRGEYLLAGIATCGYCGNSLIGLRRASRARAEVGAPPLVLTYYQCESRANQGRCAYHTRRTEALEAIVCDQLRESPAAGAGAAATPIHTTALLDARRAGLRRRLDALLERRVSGEWTAARLRHEAGSLALEDLQAEEEADFTARRRADSTEASERGVTLAEARARLVAEWEQIPFDERRRLLREVVASVVVTDDGIQVTLVG